MNELIVNVNGRKRNVLIKEKGKVEIEGKLYSISMTKIGLTSYLLRYGNRVYEIAARRDNANQFEFLIEGNYFDVTVNTPAQEATNNLMSQESLSAGISSVRVPMPGLIIKLKKKPGDPVSAGEPVLLLEAMKMENEIRSPASGVIKEIFFNEGDPVEKDSIILSIE
jgi:biotin carboxyl carrier protein